MCWNIAAAAAACLEFWPHPLTLLLPVGLKFFRTSKSGRKKKREWGLLNDWVFPKSGTAASCHSSSGSVQFPEGFNCTFPVPQWWAGHKGLLGCLGAVWRNGHHSLGHFGLFVSLKRSAFSPAPFLITVCHISCVVCLGLKIHPWKLVCAGRKQHLHLLFGEEIKWFNDCFVNEGDQSKVSQLFPCWLCGGKGCSGRTSGWESLKSSSREAEWFFLQLTLDKSPSHGESGELLMEYWEHLHPSGLTPPCLTNGSIKKPKGTTGTQVLFLVNGNINTVLLLHSWTEMVHCVLSEQNFPPSVHDLGFEIKTLCFPELRAAS